MEKIESLVNNRFLVEIDKKLGIDSYRVYGMSFRGCGVKEFIIRFTDGEDGIIKKIDKCYNNYTKLDISLSLLKPDGVISYSEEFSSCKIIDYVHSDLNYEDKSVHTIDVKFSYENKKIK